MTDKLDSVISDEEYESNVSLSYEYLEKSIKEIQDIINNTNTQLGVLIGFNFTFVRFFLNEISGKVTDLNGITCNACLWFRVLAYLFSFVSIILSFIGLYQTIEWEIIEPDFLIELIEECDRVFSWELKLTIIESWQDKLNDFKQLADVKKKLFNYSIFCLVISVLLTIYNRFIGFIFD
ncbi:MAG TPA: hypothetical protein ACFCUY_12405 [Xenococcaceae cyanobacterium]